MSLRKLSQAVSLVLLIGLAFGLFEFARSSKASAIPRARLSQTISVHASGRGNPSINLSDGRDVLTSYSGPPALTVALQNNLAQPLALASADFDEDGVPDLICGYAHSGSGIITWTRGNVDSIYPNSPEAQQRKAAGEFTDAPFLSPALVLDVPQPADFIATGDFDGDTHRDVVAAARGGDKLYVLSGDGRGGFQSSRTFSLPGVVTALITGEMNQHDGLDDLIVSVSGNSGAKLLVFEGLRGALNNEPEVFTLPAEATALAVGQLDEDNLDDLAVALNHELIIVRGRNRAPAMYDRQIGKYSPANLEYRYLPFAIRSLEVGVFDGNHHGDIGMLSEDGAVYLLSAPGKEPNEVNAWVLQAMTAPRLPRASKIVRGHVSGLAGEDLLVMDSINRELQVVQAPYTRAQEYSSAGSPAAAALHRGVMSLLAEGEPVAAVFMRLNGHARQSMVILEKGSSAPAVVFAQAADTFIVTNADDGGPGSLRQAILDAGFSAEIQFDIQPPGPKIINLSTPLPALRARFSIDGTTQPGFSGRPIIQLGGSDAGPAFGVRTGSTGGFNTIRGLVLTDIQFRNSNNIIEGNFVGTNMTGNVATAGGILISMGGDDMIGGTTSQAQNVIANIVSLSGGGGTVQGNFIGCDASGSFGLGIGGVRIVDSNEKVFDNVVSRGGVRCDMGRLEARGNFIGTNASGTSTIGNAGDGVFVFFESDFAQISGNVISGNTGNGINVRQDCIDATITGNIIGTDPSCTQHLGNSGYGILIQDGSSGNIVENNCIAFNGAAGVRLPFASSSIFSDPRRNRILFNSIFSNGGIGIDLAQEGTDPNDNMDPDSGPNDLQNFPVLTRAENDSINDTAVQGNLNSTPENTFTIDFFSNPGDSGSGIQTAAFGPCIPQGQIFIGSTIVTTDAHGNAPINIILPGASPGGFINATATSSNGNTSEFSACVQLKVINADLSVVFDAAPGAVLPGSNLSYQVTVANNGPEIATNVVLTSPVPDNTTFKNLIAPPGWTSRLPDVDKAGLITCTTSALNPGTSASFTIVVKVSPAVAEETMITSSVMVTSGVTDLKPGNNSGTAATIVSLTPLPTGEADLALDLNGSPDSVFSGEVITYTLTVTNPGTATARDVELTQAAPIHTTIESSSDFDGWTRNGPAADRIITYRNASVGPGKSVFTIVVKVDSDTPAGTEIEATASVFCKTDPNSANNSKTVTTITKARLTGPTIQSIEVSSNITVVGFGFVKPVLVFIDNIGFSDPAKVKGGTRLIQKGKLIDGRSVAEAVPPGKLVKMKFRNRDGDETEVSFRN